MLSLFKNVNALSMFVMITVLGISIYTILTYKSLLLFEKDIYRVKSQLSSIGLAVQDLMQKERERACGAGLREKEAEGEGEGEGEGEKAKRGGGQHYFPSGIQPIQNVMSVLTPMTGSPLSSNIEETTKIENSSNIENKSSMIEDTSNIDDVSNIACTSNLSCIIEDDEEVSLDEIAKLKKLVANIESDLDDEDEEDEKENDVQNIEDFIQRHSDQKPSSELTHEEDVTHVDQQKPQTSPFLTSEQLEKMKYEELRQYLRINFGISQSRGTKSQLIAKIKEQKASAIL